ncbi:MAG TPA: STAS domain-containing protein [Thermoleophilaceae bacterium]
MRAFDVKTSEQDGAVRLELSGELDISSAARAEAELRRAEEAKPELIVLDLRRLAFMDSTGLRLVVGADLRAREEGRRFAIVQGPDAIRRVFEITRLAERLQIVADPSEL